MGREPSKNTGPWVGPGLKFQLLCFLARQSQATDFTQASVYSSVKRGPQKQTPCPRRGGVHNTESANYIQAWNSAPKTRAL